MSNVNEILQAADLFLLPSLNEGLPLSAVEAQSAGLKCLLSDSIPKDVKLTENVEFISLNDKEKWKKMILDSFAYQRKNLYKAIDDKGFNIKNTSKFLEEFYKSIIN
nr:glycosyltransferase [Anaerococcus hydrogenalis]